MPSMPRIARTQQHRANTPASTSCDYYKRSLCISLIDHLLAEMELKYFSKVQMNISKFICSGPKLSADSSDDSNITAAAKFYDVIEVEFWRWRNNWLKAEKPSSPVPYRKLFEAVMPCIFIHMLLRILRTLTSAESKRSFSSLKSLKTYLRNTVSNERESSLSFALGMCTKTDHQLST